MYLFYFEGPLTFKMSYFLMSCFQEGLELLFSKSLGIFLVFGYNTEPKSEISIFRQSYFFLNFVISS